MTVSIGHDVENAHDYDTVLAQPCPLTETVDFCNCDGDDCEGENLPAVECIECGTCKNTVTIPRYIDRHYNGACFY